MTRLAIGSALVLTLLIPSPATAQQQPGSVQVLVVGPKTTTIVDDSSYAVVATMPHPPGDVVAWWPSGDATRATFVFGILQRGAWVNKQAARIQVVDLTKHQSIGDLPLGTGLGLYVASGDGKLIAATLEGRKGESSLIAVDATAGAISGRQALKDTPTHLLFAAGSTRLVSVVAGETDEQPEDRIPGRIDLFDMPALEPRGSIAVPGAIAALFWNADQTLLYALDQGVESKRPERVRPRRVYVIDPAAATMSAVLELGPPSKAWDGETIGVVPAPDHQQFYILEESAIEILDGKLSAVAGAIPLKREPGGMTFFDASRAYIHHADSGFVTALDLPNRKALAEINTGGAGAKAGKWAMLIGGALLSAGGLAAGAGAVPVMVPGRSFFHDTTTSGLLAPDGKSVLISNNQNWDVTAIDGSTNEVLARIGGGFPTFLADGRTAAIAESRRLTLYDSVERKVLPTPLPLDNGGTVCPDGRHVWTGQSAEGFGRVYRIDLETRTPAKPLDGVTGTAFFVMSTPTVR